MTLAWRYFQYWNLDYFSPTIIVIWALSFQIANGTITTKCKWLRCDKIASHYDVTQLGVFWHMVFCWWYMEREWPNHHGYWMQQNFLKHLANLLKPQAIQNICQTNRLIDQFCWIWLPKRTKKLPASGQLRPDSWDKFPFWKPYPAKLVGDTNWPVMVQHVSFVYEKLLWRRIFILSGSVKRINLLLLLLLLLLVVRTACC